MWYFNWCLFILQELFIQDITREAYSYTKDNKRKTMQKKDLGITNAFTTIAKLWYSLLVENSSLFLVHLNKENVG